MRVYNEPPAVDGGYRLQPWEGSDVDPRARYYDFKKNLEIIPDVLEDFQPLKHYQSIQRFFGLLRWLNGPGSPFETNDSRIRHAAPNGDKHLSNKAQVRSGELMFFFRNLTLNLAEDSEIWWERYQRYEVDQYQLNLRPSKALIWLGTLLTQKLEKENQESFDDCICLRLAPVFYTDAPVKESEKFGHELILKFWLWGDDDDEMMMHFNKTVSAIEKCFKAMAVQVRNRKNLKTKNK